MLDVCVDIIKSIKLFKKKRIFNSLIPGNYN